MIDLKGLGGYNGKLLGGAYLEWVLKGNWHGYENGAVFWKKPTCVNCNTELEVQMKCSWLYPAEEMSSECSSMFQERSCGYSCKYE